MVTATVEGLAGGAEPCPSELEPVEQPAARNKIANDR
jgi:hypothetical protein